MVRQPFWVWVLALLIMSAPLLAQAQDVANPHCLKTHILKPTLENQDSFGDEDIKLTLRLETASTPKARRKGLMHRKTLAPCDGMAFWFAPLSTYRVENLTNLQFAPQKFWMKDTIIPLDILFLDASNTIIYIATAEALSEKPVGPDAPVATVIEIAGGRAKKEGIEVGAKVLYEISIPTWQLAR